MSTDIALPATPRRLRRPSVPLVTLALVIPALVTPAPGRTARTTVDNRTTTALEAPVSDALLRLVVRVRPRTADPEADRGDVPGWVMITLMTAGIVSLIWGVADDALTGLFNDAIEKAKSPT